MKLIGCPPPLLQTPFRNHRGLIGFADFFWPELSIVGEADGDMKYLNPNFRGGKSAEEVLVDQLKRENRLRALGLTITRWDWATAASLTFFRAHLRAAGVPMRAR